MNVIIKPEEYFKQLQSVCDYLKEKRRDKNTQHKSLKYRGFSFWEASQILDTNDDFVIKKKCNKCGKEKLLRQFHRDKTNRLKDNVKGSCKVCRKKENKEYYYKDHEKTKKNKIEARNRSQKRKNNPKEISKIYWSKI